MISVKNIKFLMDITEDPQTTHPEMSSLCNNILDNAEFSLLKSWEDSHKLCYRVNIKLNGKDFQVDFLCMDESYPFDYLDSKKGRETCLKALEYWFSGVADAIIVRDNGYLDVSELWEGGLFYIAWIGLFEEAANTFHS